MDFEELQYLKTKSVVFYPAICRNYTLFSLKRGHIFALQSKTNIY